MSDRMGMSTAMSKLNQILSERNAPAEIRSAAQASLTYQAETAQEAYPDMTPVFTIDDVEGIVETAFDDAGRGVSP